MLKIPAKVSFFRNFSSAPFSLKICLCFGFFWAISLSATALLLGSGLFVAFVAYSLGGTVALLGVLVVAASQADDFGSDETSDNAQKASPIIADRSVPEADLL